MTKDRRLWWGLVGVMAVAFALRMAWVLHVHTYPISDFAGYQERALGLLEGKGYVGPNGKPTAYWPIGYPLFLAGLYKVFGAHLYIAKAANVLMGTLTAGLTYLLGHRMAGFWTGLLAGLGIACLPSYIEWTSVLNSEIVFTLLLVSSAYLLVAIPPDRQGWLYPAAAGALLGAATLTRATSLALPIGVLLLYWVFRRNLVKALVPAAVFVLVMSAVIAPMTLRNYLVFHAFVPISTNGGINLWMGNNPHATGEYYWPEDPTQNPLIGHSSSEVELDRKATRLALAFIREHPQQFLHLLGVKFNKFYDSDVNALVFSLQPTDPKFPGEWADAITDVANRYYRILKIVSLIGLGLVVVARRWIRDWPTVFVSVGMIAYFTAVHSVMPAWDRYRFPIMPFMALFAGYAPGVALALARTGLGLGKERS